MPIVRFFLIDLERLNLNSNERESSFRLFSSAEGFTSAEDFTSCMFFFHKMA